MSEYSTFDIGIRFQGVDIAVISCQKDTLGKEVKNILCQEQPEFKEENISLYFSGHEIADDDLIFDKILHAFDRKLDHRIGIFQELTQSPLCFLTMMYEKGIRQVKKAKRENRVDQEKKREEQAWRGGEQGGIRLIIHQIADVSLELFADPLDTVQDLKYQVQKLQGMPVSKQGMIYCGKSLSDNLSLRQAGLANGSNIWIMCR